MIHLNLYLLHSSEAQVGGVTGGAEWATLKGVGQGNWHLKMNLTGFGES